MSITLKLVNVDPLATGVRIYRATGVATNPASLGTPVADLPTPVASWVDTAVANNTVYHYRIESYNASISTLGNDIAVGYFPDAGPGAGIVTRGDWYSGWMDEIDPATFADATTLLAALNAVATGGIVVPAWTGTLASWQKIAFNGKIYLIPIGIATTTLTWLQVYNAGFMFGTNDVGTKPTLTALTVGVNQQRVITLNNYRFKVRTIKAGLVDTNNYQTTGQTLGEPHWMTSRLVQQFNGGLLTAHETALNDQLMSNLCSMTTGISSAAAILAGTSDPEILTSGTPSQTGIRWFPILEYAPGL